MTKKIYLTIFLLTIFTSFCFSGERIKPVVLLDSQTSISFSVILLSSDDVSTEEQEVDPSAIHFAQDTVLMHSKSNLGIGLRISYNQSLSLESMAVPIYIFGSIDRYIKLGVGYAYLSGPNYTGNAFEPVIMGSINYPVLQIGDTYFNLLYDMEMNVSSEPGSYEYLCMSFGFSIMKKPYNNLLNKILYSEYTSSFE